MENSETEGEDSSLVKWGRQKGSNCERIERSGRDPDKQRRKDKVID